MDRRTVFPDQIPFDTDVLMIERNAYEALGQFARDILGDTTVVARLPCVPTAPASMSVKVGAGSLYALENLDDTAWGGIGGSGGLAADVNADHKILKQGLHRDTETFALTVPATVGQSVVYLIEAQFQESDDAGVTTQLYNVDNPNAPISASLSPDRLNKCVLQVKVGTPAATGSQVEPAADAGWVPVWKITVAHTDVSLDASHIVRSPSCPLVSVGGGGGGSSLTAWAVLAANHTAAPGDRYLCDTSGGVFTLTLPATPAAGTEVTFKVNAATNNLTIGRNGQTINGSATNLTVDKDNVTAFLVFDGTTWRV